MKSQENMVPYQEKILSTKINPDMYQMLELIDNDFK